jgi:TonB family protein
VSEAKPTPAQPELAHAAPSRPGTKSAGTKDSTLARFERDIQKVGTRVLDKRRLPQLANMGKNWSGKAQIEVQFAAGGYISRIVLAESCGHPPLDEKALELARSINFPHVPKELSSRDFSVRFPIEFRSGKG